MARLIDDEQIRAMLLLHGLHPEDMTTRVRRAVERLTPHLGVHGLRLDLVEIAGGQVRLRLSDSGAGTIQKQLLWALPREIEDAIVEAAPDVEIFRSTGLIASMAEPPPSATDAATNGKAACRFERMTASGQTGNWVRKLQRFVQPPSARAEAEYCELCASPIPPRHPHLVEPAKHRLHLRLPRLRPSAGKS